MHGGLQLAKTGRKRKMGARKPCGRLVQEALESRGGPAAARRAMDHVLGVANDAALATVLGRMFLLRTITAAEYNAGCKLAVLRAKADHALGVPARNPKALQFDAARGLSLIAEDPERDISIIEALDAAMDAAGTAAERSAVEDVAFYDELPAGHAERVACKRALANLVKHWRLEN